MIIGITGTIGAGKGTIAEYLSKKGFRHLSVSAFLAEEARRQDRVPTRVVCREIANEFRAKGATALIEEVLAGIDVTTEKIVIESLHTVPEVVYVQNLGGKVLSVDAPLLVRYGRTQSRGEEKDRVPFEDFSKEQSRQMASENENENNLRATIASADFHIENAEISEGLFVKIDDILEQLYEPIRHTHGKSI